MEDRLRQLLDLVIASLDAPGTDGRVLADRASFSRDHLDRLLAAATGESPVAMRRRLLLERAAWQLRSERTTAAQAAIDADFGSPEAFSRAFSRAFGVSPGRFRDEDRPVRITAPNGVHFHPPAGLVVPQPSSARTLSSAAPPRAHAPTGVGAQVAARHDLTDRLVTHHLDRSGTLLDAAATLPTEALQRPLRPGFVAVWFEGEEPSAALMAERLVRTLEVWTAAIVGETAPEVPGIAERPSAQNEVDASEPGAPADDGAANAPPFVHAPDVDIDGLRSRLARVAPKFSRVARSIRDRGAWDDAFVDALCEPPQSFTYGGVLAHVITYGAIRREMLASVLAELGAVPPSGPETPDGADPILWEQQRRWD
ncbi:MAG: AraC family transcriptional regulator [Patulibacter sp.]